MDDALPPSSSDVAPLQLVVLHLLPGVVQMTAFAVLARPMLAAGAPRALPFLIAVVVGGLPCMLAVLLRARSRGAARALTGRPLVGNRAPMPRWEYVALYVMLFALSLGVLWATAPLNQLLAEKVFFWLPDYLQPQWQPPAPPARALVLLSLVVQVLIDGVLAPVTEEVYFRGYLLPRMRYLRGWAPAVNALLFAVQHFWQPYNQVMIFLHSLLLTYVVWWKQNIYIAMLVHGSANTIAAVLALVEFLTS
jgi:membrane protease YdiL (CAAX protease family)